MLKELERLKTELSKAEEVEKATSEKKAEDEKADDERPESKDKTVENVSHVEVNGDDSETSSKDPPTTGFPSLDSESTAVNTPNGTSTPTATKETLDSIPTETTTDDKVVGASGLRLQVQHLEKLTKFLEKEFAPTRQKLKDLAVSGEIKFNLLWALYRLGTVITFRDHESGLIMAGEVYLFINFL